MCVCNKEKAQNVFPTYTMLSYLLVFFVVVAVFNALEAEKDQAV